MRLSKKILLMSGCVALVAPLAVGASQLTDSQVSAIITLLQSFGVDASTIANVRATLTNQTPPPQYATWCHTFTRNMGVGSFGDEVTALKEALSRERVYQNSNQFSEYDEDVASAVSEFQEDYDDEILTPGGLAHGTGYLGALTRKKLNELYGCADGQTYNFLPPPAPPPLPNYLRNTGFEQDFLTSNDWVPEAYLGGCQFIYDSSMYHSGARSARVSCLDKENDARWVQKLSVNPNAEYVLSGWIKTENVAHTSQPYDTGASLYVMDVPARTNGLLGTHDWTFEKVEFNSGKHTALTIGARLGDWGGVTTGTAWFDDIKLEPAVSATSTPRTGN